MTYWNGKCIVPSGHLIEVMPLPRLSTLVISPVQPPTSVVSVGGGGASWWRRRVVTAKPSHRPAVGTEGTVVSKGTVTDAACGAGACAAAEAARRRGVAAARERCGEARTFRQMPIWLGSAQCRRRALNA